MKESLSCHQVALPACDFILRLAAFSGCLKTDRLYIDFLLKNALSNI